MGRGGISLLGAGAPSPNMGAGFMRLRLGLLGKSLGLGLRPCHQSSHFAIPQLHEPGLSPHRSFAVLTEVSSCPPSSVSTKSPPGPPSNFGACTSIGCGLSGGMGWVSTLELCMSLGVRLSGF